MKAVLLEYWRKFEVKYDWCYRWFCHLFCVLEQMVLIVNLEHASVKFKSKVKKISLTHWGLVMHTCVCKLTIIGSGNILSPGRHQAIIWSNAEILLIGPLGTHFSEILIEIHTFSFKKIHLKRSSEKWWPFCLDLNMLRKCMSRIS